MIDTGIDWKVRLSITRFFASHGLPPTTYEIAALEGYQNSEIATAYRDLHDRGQILLCEDDSKLRAAHPYSAIPTAYWIESENVGWWANCAFCALGVAVIASRPVKIYARLGAMRESITLQIKEQQISNGELRLHIPLPVRKWHDDIVYTCSNVHIFQSSRDIDEWARAKFLPRGIDISLKQAWSLATEWYANYLDDGWVPHSALKLREICDTCGLSGDFWEPK
jgi:hypothetical protein